MAKNRPTGHNKVVGEGSVKVGKTDKAIDGHSVSPYEDGGVPEVWKKTGTDAYGHEQYTSTNLILAEPNKPHYENPSSLRTDDRPHGHKKKVGKGTVKVRKTQKLYDDFPVSPEADWSIRPSDLKNENMVHSGMLGASASEGRAKSKRDKMKAHTK